MSLFEVQPAVKILHFGVTGVRGMLGAFQIG